MQITKVCTICRSEKPSSEFHSKTASCKPCKSVLDRTRGDRSAKRRAPSAASRARQRRYALKRMDAERQRARRLVRSAIESGSLVRPSACEECGSSKTRSDGATAIQAHHDDYSKPLHVRWLCVACHTKWHKQHDAARSQEAAG